MSKIKLKIVKFEKALAVQILEMDERFRATRDPHKNYEYPSKGGLIIKSEGHADVYPESIFLLGRDKNDLEIMEIKLPSNKERDEYFDKLKASLKDWSDNWEGFKEDLPDKENDIYEF